MCRISAQESGRFQQIQSNPTLAALTAGFAVLKNCQQSNSLMVHNTVITVQKITVTELQKVKTLCFGILVK